MSVNLLMRWSPWISNVSASEVLHLSPPGRGEPTLRRNRAPPRHLAQAEPARDDAAQDFRGAALNRQFRRGLDRERQLLFQRLAVARVLLDKGGQLAHPVRQLLFPHRADVLDDRR